MGSVIWQIFFFSPLVNFLLLATTRGKQRLLTWISIGTFSLSLLAQVIFFVLFRFYQDFSVIAPGVFSVDFSTSKSFWLSIVPDGIGLIFGATSALLICLYLFVMREKLENKTSAIAGLSVFYSAFLLCLLTQDFFTFLMGLTAMVLPRLFLLGGGHTGGGWKIRLLGEVMTISFLGVVALLICLLVFVGARSGLVPGTDWFELSFSSWEVKPRVLGFALLYLSVLMISGSFPFHSVNRRIFQRLDPSSVLPSVLLPLVALSLLTRFGLVVFSDEFRIFRESIVIFSAVGALTGVIGLAWVEGLRARVFWIQQVFLHLCFLGVFSLNVSGLQGAIYLAVHQVLAVGIFLIINNLEGLAGGVSWLSVLKRIPRLGLMSILSQGFLLCFPLSLGFWGCNLILRSMVRSSDIATGLTLVGIPLFLRGASGLLGLKKENRLDVDREIPNIDGNRDFVFLPVFLLLFLMGIVPEWFLGVLKPGLELFLKQVGL